MRPVREITAEEENFRTEEIIPGNGRLLRITRDPVEPEPVGTVILIPFRITGYDKDCDGSLMARLDAIDKNGETTGWRQDCVGLYPNSNLVVTAEELKKMFEGQIKEKTS